MSSQPSPPRASSPKPSKQPADAARAIFREAQGARQGTERLLPLLELLDPPMGEGEQPDPIEELKMLLEQIVLGMRHQQAAIEDLTSHVIAIREGRRLGKSPGERQ